jgi:hypothetical protein
MLALGRRPKTENQGLCFSMIEISPQNIDKLTLSEEVSLSAKGYPKETNPTPKYT